jgi:hypothetical protein
MKKNSPINKLFCILCKGEIKNKKEKYPVRLNLEFVGWCHRGCGIRSSKNNMKAHKNRRLFVAGHYETGVDEV